jgi:hypothetical protein
MREPVRLNFTGAGFACSTEFFVSVDAHAVKNVRTRNETASVSL